MARVLLPVHELSQSTHSSFQSGSSRDLIIELNPLSVELCFEVEVKFIFEVTDTAVMIGVVFFISVALTIKR